MKTSKHDEQQSICKEYQRILINWTMNVNGYFITHAFGIPSIHIH